MPGPTQPARINTSTAGPRARTRKETRSLVTAPTLLGSGTSDGGYRANQLRHGGHPTGLMPILRRIWTTTYQRDTAAMTAVLARHHWHRLDPDIRGGHRIPGVGVIDPHQSGPTIAAALNEVIGSDAEWLYLLDNRWQTVVVYDASCHRTWLRHGVHHLHPVEELFVLEIDDSSEMTVCTVCGAVNEIDDQEMPSMAGYGRDISTTCLRCGSAVITDPMFGTHTVRKPWPPATKP